MKPAQRSVGTGDSGPYAVSTAERALLDRLDRGEALQQADDSLRPVPTLYWKRAGGRREEGDLLGAASDFQLAARWLEQLYVGDDSCGEEAPGWLLVQALGSAGECLLLAGRCADGVPVLQAALDSLSAYRERCGGQERSRTRQSLGWLHVSLSECLRLTGDPGRALGEAEQALAEGDAAGWQVTLGLALQELGRHGEAVAAFERSLEQDSALTASIGHAERSRRALAAQNSESRDPEMTSADRQAIAELLDAAEQHDDSGDVEGAERLLDQVVARAPHSSVGWYRRGMLRLFEQENYDGALSDFTRAGDLGIVHSGVPGAQLEFVTGEALFGLDRYEEAGAHLRRAVEVEDDPVLQAEIYYRLAECADELNRQDELRDALGAFLDRSAAFLDFGGDESQVEWARERLAELDGE